MKKTMNLIILMYFCAIIFILPISINETTIYIGTIVNIVFIFSMLLRVRILKFNNKEKLLCVFIFIYCVTAFINLFIIKQNLIIYTINKVTPLISLSLLIGYSNGVEFDIKRILKISQYFLCSIIVISFIMHILGYSGIKLDGSTIKFIPKQYFIDMFGEVRMTWIFTHKSRFAIVCFLNIGLLLINKDIRVRSRRILILISMIDIYLSSSISLLFIALIILLVAYLKINFKTKREIFLKYSISIFLSISMVLAIPKIINWLSESRDVFSLGGRIYIWEAGINKGLENLFGIGRFTEYDWLITEKLPGGLYTNAHNVFINEIVERGIIPGIMFILIFILLIFMLNNNISKYIVMGCILSAMMDNTLTNEASYIFWLIIFIYYRYEKKYYLDK